MRKKLMTLSTSVTAMAMVFGTGITAYAAGIPHTIEDNRAGGLGTDLFQYGKGVCSGGADSFQTMTSMLDIERYVYDSHNLEHG